MHAIEIKKSKHLSYILWLQFHCIAHILIARDYLMTLWLAYCHELSLYIVDIYESGVFLAAARPE